MREAKLNSSLSGFVLGNKVKMNRRGQKMACVLEREKERETELERERLPLIVSVQYQEAH